MTLGHIANLGRAPTPRSHCPPRGSRHAWPEPWAGSLYISGEAIVLPNRDRGRARGREEHRGLHPQSELGREP